MGGTSGLLRVVAPFGSGLLQSVADRDGRIEDEGERLGYSPGCRPAAPDDVPEQLVEQGDEHATRTPVPTRRLRRLTLPSGVRS
jgi:hypothetical protein